MKNIQIEYLNSSHTLIKQTKLTKLVIQMHAEGKPSLAF
jgi:hypothetical protein